jgi:hypothetical protein
MSMTGQGSGCLCVHSIDIDLSAMSDCHRAIPISISRKNLEMRIARAVLRRFIRKN